MASRTPLAVEPKGVFPLEVAIHVVRLACERPDILGRHLSPWDGPELARQLIAERIVEAIAASTVRRLLAAHQLKPWRHHRWLHPKPPRDAAFSAIVTELLDLYTRTLRANEIVLSLDEKTSLPPRPRPSRPLPARPHPLPHRVEHEYKRAGALHLLAALDTRSGKVYGHGDDRKRPRAFLAGLEAVAVEVEAHIRTIPLVCNHGRTPQGKAVRQW